MFFAQETQIIRPLFPNWLETIVSQFKKRANTFFRSRFLNIHTIILAISLLSMASTSLLAEVDEDQAPPTHCAEKKIIGVMLKYTRRVMEEMVVVRKVKDLKKKAVFRQMIEESLGHKLHGSQISVLWDIFKKTPDGESYSHYIIDSTKKIVGEKHNNPFKVQKLDSEDIGYSSPSADGQCVVERRGSDWVPVRGRLPRFTGGHTGMFGV